MEIWHVRPSPEQINRLYEKTAAKQLSILITEVGDDFLQGEMPVATITHQPLGMLHGGASVLFAETLGSAAANFCVDQSKFYCVGMEINANHIRGVRSGVVQGVAKPVHLGRSTQVWDIRITHPQAGLVCASRLTVAVLNHRDSQG